MKLGPEDKLQLAVLEYLELVIDEPYECYHTPNSGRRTQAAANLFKMLGVTPGVPDLTLITGRGLNFIELKHGKNKPSAAQADFMSRVRSLGCGTAVCYSIEDVRNALKAWGIRTREVAA